jgi:integrase
MSSNWGNIRELPSGRFDARFMAPDGVRTKAPHQFRTRTDARVWLNQTWAAISAGTWVDPATVVVIPNVGEAVTGYIAHPPRDLQDSTTELYLGLQRQFIDRHRIAKMRLDMVTMAVVEDWHRTLKTSPARGAQAYRLLRAAFREQLRHGVINRSPCQVLSAGLYKAPERPLLSPADVAVINAAMPADLRPLITTLLWTHLRLGEALALTVTVSKSVKRVRGRAVVGTPKTTGSNRTVAMPEQAVAALRAHLAANPAVAQARIFRRPDGSELRHHHVQNEWRAAADDLGFPRARLHDLRHAGLTLVAQTGATLKEIQARAGHSSVAAAMIYQHAAASRDATIANLLSQATGGTA